MAQRSDGAAAIVANLERRQPPDGPEAQFGQGSHLRHPHPNDFGDYSGGEPSCTIKQLPSRLQFKAAAVASMINPVNEPAFGLTAAAAEGVLPSPLAIAVATAKYWGPKSRTLTVSFMDSTPADLRRRIISHMNAWTRTSCVGFVETASGGQVRISRGSGGYWSYLGTDILLIPASKPTMNLQSFSMSTSESEYLRVVRHEAGHTLAFPHEHMRKDLVRLIDPAKAYRFFLNTYGWDKATVDQQVLTSLDERTLMGTPVDQDSIMCYQLPGTITTNGQPIRGGTDINSTDFAFAGRIYPRTAASEPQIGTVAAEDDWPESEDVDANSYAA